MTMQTPRNFNQEYQDDDDRKFAYDFDYVLRDYMMRSFAPFLPTGRALEMGCYKGEFTKKLCSHFDHVTVIEGASDLIEAARDNLGEENAGKVDFLHGSFETIFLANEFDAVFLMHTLEHLDDPIGVLKRVKGWLKPQGKLFLVVPNANAPSRQIAVKMGLISHIAAVTEGEQKHGHRRTYSFDTLERDVRASGLGVQHRGGIFFKPLANYQFDRLMKTNIISKEYMDGCYELGMIYPDLCASIYFLCGKGA